MKNFLEPGLNNKNLFRPQSVDINNNYNNKYNNIDTSSKIRLNNNNINNNYSNINENNSYHKNVKIH